MRTYKNKGQSQAGQHSCAGRGFPTQPSVYKLDARSFHSISSVLAIERMAPNASSILVSSNLIMDKGEGKVFLTVGEISLE